MLSINALSKQFAARVVLNKITYNFPTKGILALVGTNGAGKSTLLNILCGLEQPDTGSLNKAKEYQIGYLPQDPSSNPQATILEEGMSGHEQLYSLRSDFNRLSDLLTTSYTDQIYEQFESTELAFRNMNGYTFEHNATKILLGIGFKEHQLLEDPKILSGGWRMRLELAKLLLKSPDLLILDEPTNHLDLPTIIWLEKYLKTFPGTILFVSHDESLLRNMPNIILHLKDGNLTQYMGNYDNFLQQYEMRQAASVAQIKNISSKIDNTQKFIDRFGAKASKATQAQSRMKMISRLQDQLNDVEVSGQDAQINVQIPLKTKSGKDVVILESCAIGYNKALVKNINLIITRGQKIAVVGANGLGKSTFLKTLINKTPSLAGKIQMGHNVKTAYYAQNQVDDLNLNLSVIENLIKVDPNSISENKARGVLGAFLFKGNDIYKNTSVLSGGEKSRLSLACLMMQDANLLLLDEPTNHLDILSTNILSQGLSDFEGSVIFVSHNRNFINSFATHILLFNDNGSAHLLKGNLDECNLEN